MAMIDDVYAAAESATIEVGDKTKVQSAHITFRQTTAGDVVTVHFEMKPGVVTFPPGLEEYNGKIVMET